MMAMFSSENIRIWRCTVSEEPIHRVLARIASSRLECEKSFTVAMLV